jgi:hypothetical protein
MGRRSVSVSLAGLLLSACGGSNTGTSGEDKGPGARPTPTHIEEADAAPTPTFNQPDFVPDAVTFDVEWRDHAHVIEEADGKALLVGDAPDESTLSYVFDDSAESIRSLQPGDIAVLAGVAYRKVVSVTETDAGIELETARTTLPEAISAGTIDWAQTIDFSSSEALDLMQLSYGSLPLKRLAQLELPGPITYEGDLEGDYHVSVSLDPGASGLALDITVKKQILGEDRFALQASGTLQGFQTHGHLVLDGAGGVEFDHGNRNIAGDIHLRAIAFNTGASQELLYLPIGIDIPLQVGPVPLLLKLKVAVNVTLELNVADSSAEATVDLHFQGNSGISVTGSSLNANASLDSGEAAGFAGGSADAIAAGLAACVEAPRIELSMLGEFASVGLTQNNCASTYFTFTPACNSVRGSITGLALASLGFFGFTLAEGQVELYKHADDLTVGGAACEDPE